MDIEDWIGWGYVNEVEWRLLDRAQAREEIRRFVERAQRGDLTSPPILHDAVEEEETVKGMGHGEDQGGGPGHWHCTKCGELGPEPATKLLDRTYGTARCPSSACKRERRIFHREVNRDDNQKRLGTG